MFLFGALCLFFSPAYGDDIRERQCWKTGLLPFCSSGKLSSRSQTFLSFRIRRAGFFQPWGPPTGLLYRRKAVPFTFWPPAGANLYHFGLRYPSTGPISPSGASFCGGSRRCCPTRPGPTARPGPPARLRLTADLQRTLIQSPNQRRSNRKQILGTEYQQI